MLNRLVATGRPASLALERLDFRNPALSRRLNAILRNCGRSVIEAKLRDMEERHGITSEEVNPAYTSQTCSCCGYVDKRNRRSQSAFGCLWCGQVMHADLKRGAEHRGAPCVAHRFRAAGEGGGPRRTRARVRGATGSGIAPGPNREQGCPRRPARDQPPLRWGAACRASEVRTPSGTRCCARYRSLIVPSLEDAEELVAEDRRRVRKPARRPSASCSPCSR